MLVGVVCLMVGLLCVYIGLTCGGVINQKPALRKDDGTNLQAGDTTLHMADDPRGETPPSMGNATATIQI